jgi:hypothetical protein
MATKKEPGNAPAPEPEPKKPVTEPGSVPEPTPEPEPYEPPERFQGKKLKDVIEMFEKTEKERDRSGTEVGELRKELDGTKNSAFYYQNQAQDLQTKLERGGVKPEGEATPDLTGFYDNPLPLMEQVIDSRLKKDREVREEAEQKQEYQRASMNFAVGRSEAMKSDPELFKGIERQLEEGMWAYWKAKKISVEELARTKTWINGARMIHLANEDLDRLVPPKIVPLSPTPTEKPGAAKPDLPEEKPIQFNPDQRDMIRGLGGKDFTDKEVTEMAKKERELMKKEAE